MLKRFWFILSIFCNALNIAYLKYFDILGQSQFLIKLYNEKDLMKERENLYMTSPIDLINYIQTSVEILMNIKVEDYIANKKEKERKEKIVTYLLV